MVNESLTYEHHVRFTHHSVHTICDNGDRITESAKSGLKLFV